MSNIHKDDTEYEYATVKRGVGEKMVGQPVRRREDARLLTGRGHYVDDIKVADALHMTVRRSDYAHARIVSIDTDEAKALPGVFGVYVMEDLKDCIKPAIATSRMADYQATTMYALAKDTVHYVGEPVVVVLAESRYIAEDALELLQIEYEMLPVVNDAEEAAQEGAPLLHSELSSNVLVQRVFQRGDVDAVFAEAPVVVSDTFRFHRKTSLAMEVRTYLAQVDAGRDSLTLHTSSQVPGIVRDALANLLGMDGNRVLVVAPDVGGGFGSKTSLYQEEMLVCALARKTGKAIRWTGDRLEDLVSTSQAFDEKVRAELALDADGNILALRADVIGDVGAYSIYPWTAGIEPVQVVSFMPGPYRVPAYRGSVRGVATPKAPTGPYRGVGRPISTFVMERLVDMAAKQLDVDPVQIRLKNLVRPEEFPYKTPVGIVWDKSAFIEGLESVCAHVDYQQLRKEQAEARAQGRFVGIGVASYAELSGIGSRISASPGMPINTGTDICVLQFDSTGAVTAAFGCASHGQGHETALAQVVADELGAAIEHVRVIQGNSGAVPHSTGSYASRTAVISGGAGILASRELRERMLRIAAYLFDVTPGEILINESVFSVPGTDKQLSFSEFARAVFSQMGRVPQDIREDLSVTRMYDPVFGTTSSSTHLAVVEVDPLTCKVEIKRYAIAEDCGRMINPLIVDGQTRGAVAQGIGAAFFEEVHYDAEGQLLSASLVDYLIPTAPDIPNIEIIHLDTEAPNTLGGFRGVGEGGTIGAPAVLANAVTDALSQYGVQINELPMTPERLFRAINTSTNKTELHEFIGEEK